MYSWQQEIKQLAENEEQEKTKKLEPSKEDFVNSDQKDSKSIEKSEEEDNEGYNSADQVGTPKKRLEDSETKFEKLNVR